MKRYMKSSSIICALLFLIACSRTADISDNRASGSEVIQTQAGAEMDFHGIIVEKDKSSVVVVIGLTEKDVAGKTVDELIDKYDPEIYKISTKGITAQLNVGDSVNVWTNGMYEDSRIVQTTATKIEKSS
ncbi:DUF3221 domain-containing protein [Cohnella sp. GCM10020058]|uniref:DUF3221 domain-containing protein n=1 Tax=Cohnella sp. GCM10020058 TaxID=3317330 RepID=UPI003635744B